MSSFKELKSRIAGVKNIQQITRAMKMVAGARLRRAEEAILTLRPYSSRLDWVCARLLTGAMGGEHAFLTERPVRAFAVLAICSDRGLCGAYNNRVIDATLELLAQRPGQSHLLLVVGHKGVTRLKRAGCQVHRAYEDIFNPVHFTTAQAIRAELASLFLSGRADEVLVVFSEFFSPMRHPVITRRLLPCPVDGHRRQIVDHYDREVPQGVHVAAEELAEPAREVYVYEPDYQTICDRLLEYNLGVQVYWALLEAQASEHGARMMAMDNATENAEDMIEELTLLMNRVRQESITSEMLDVVGGAEATKE